MHGVAFLRKKSNSALRKDGCTRLLLSHIWAQMIFLPGSTVSHFSDCLCHDFILLVLVNKHLVASYSLYPKVISMAEPNQSTMKRVIQVVSECYSMHRLDPSVSSSDRIYFQNLLESSNIKFHNHSLSNTLIRQIVLVLFKMRKEK